jgi:hypothetical protein
MVRTSATGREDVAMKLALGGSVAVAATLLLVGCEDQHDRYGYGGYPGGGYAGYPGSSYGGDAYDSYDDWRYRAGRGYGCDGGGCPYYYSNRRDGCDWSECRDPDRRPVVIYDRSRRQYVYVFVPRNRYGDNDRGSAGDNDRSGRRSGGWDRPDRNDAPRSTIEQRRDDGRGIGDEDARRRQRDADEQVFRQSRDRDRDAREQHQGQGRDADQDRGRADRSGSQQRGQDRTDQRDRGGRDQNQRCGPGGGCSG